MLNTLHLRTFLAVVDAGNYTAAAEQLHMSQPAVSMHIRALEEQLGTIRLFRRIGQRMVPTHAGEELLTTARELMALSERVEQNIRALRGHITGRVAIGCTPGSAEHLLPPLLTAFLAQFPEVAIEVLVETGEDLLESLSSQRLSLLFFEEQQRRRGWESHLLGIEHLVLLAPPDHPLVQQTDGTLGMLHEYPLILPRSNEPLRRTIEHGLRQRGINPADIRVGLETSSTTMMIKSVAGGLGVAFVPITSVPPECNLARVGFSGDALRQEWCVVRLRERGAIRAAQELASFLTSTTARALLRRQGLLTE